MSLLPERFLVMIVVYADETGTHGMKATDKEPAPGIYGYMADKVYWDRFSQRWSAGLRKYNAKYFHFRELNPSERQKPGNPYFGWSNERADDFIYDMATIASHGAIPVGGGASVKKIQGKLAKPPYTQTYEAVFDVFFENALEQFKKHYPKSKDMLSFVFDHSDNKEWTRPLHLAFDRLMEGNPRIVSGVEFVHSRSCNPCQAADLFAAVNRQNLSNIYEADRYVHLRLLDLIVGRHVFPDGHLLRALRRLSHAEWVMLVKRMRIERSKFNPRNDYNPILNSDAIKPLLRHEIRKQLKRI